MRERVPAPVLSSLAQLKPLHSAIKRCLGFLGRRQREGRGGEERSTGGGGVSNIHRRGSRQHSESRRQSHCLSTRGTFFSLFCISFFLRLSPPIPPPLCPFPLLSFLLCHCLGSSDFTSGVEQNFTLLRQAQALWQHYIEKYAPFFLSSPYNSV